MSYEAIDDSNLQNKDKPEAPSITGIEASIPESLGPVVMRLDQDLTPKPTVEHTSEPSTEELREAGELQGTTEIPATTTYTQPPAQNTVAGVFAAGLKEAMNKGAQQQSKSEIVVATTFATIKTMAAVFAQTMRETELPPYYEKKDIPPDDPNVMQRLLHTKLTSPGFVLTPYWIVLSGSDLSGRDMRSEAIDENGNRRYIDHGLVGYTERAIGVTPDGKLINLTREYAFNTKNLPDFSCDTTKPVGPEELFSTDGLGVDDTKPDQPAGIISDFEQRLKERGIENQKRNANTSTYGYEPVEVMSQNDRKSRWHK